MKDGGPQRIEWPTLVVAAAIAGGFTAVFLVHHHLPLVVVVALLGTLSAWYGSLQHEVIHGHPTPWSWCNTALAIVPVDPVVPFRSYRDLHLAHHRTPWLTDPDLDPESFYVTRVMWQRAGPVHRVALRTSSTLAGRLLFGPIVMAARWLRRGMRGCRTRAGAARGLGHGIGVCAVLVVVDATGMSVVAYLVATVWVGPSLSLLRSFAEHRTTPTGTRSAVVRAGPLLSLLYLHNNLHHTHHVRPHLAWYRLPALHEAIDADRIAASGAGLYRGYGEVVRRYLVRPFDDPVHRPVA